MAQVTEAAHTQHIPATLPSTETPALGWLNTSTRENGQPAIEGLSGDAGHAEGKHPNLESIKPRGSTRLDDNEGMMSKPALTPSSATERQDADNRASSRLNGHTDER